MTTKPTLYALLVGINDYKSPKVPNLEACEQDIKKVDAYLTTWCEEQGVIYQPKLLLSAAATRAAIIEHFTTHLGQATSEDRILFYYSGHGAQEQAHEAFHDTEHDGNLETLVCHDSRTEEIPDLADKELRYLIHQVTQNRSHALMVFDCCHSGTNTKSPELIRRYGPVAPQREWSQFLFSKVYPTAADFTAKGGTDKILPQGEHIQIAACQDFELAYESPRTGGYFTNAFIAALKQNNGAISYFALRNTIRYRIARMHIHQTPQIYTHTATSREQAIFTPFLDGKYTIPSRTVTVLYQRHVFKRSWIVDVGELHGLVDNNTKQKIEVYENDTLLLTTKVSKAFFGYAQLDIPRSSILETKTQYSGKVYGMMQSVTRFYIKSLEDDRTNHLKKQLTTNQSSTAIIFVAEELAADFTLNSQYIIDSQNTTCFFSNPNSNQPLFGEIHNPNQEQLQYYFQTIAKWNFVKNLSPIQMRKPNPIHVELSTMAMSVPVQDGIGVVSFSVAAIDRAKQGKRLIDTLTITLQNNGKYPLFFHVLLLTEEFGIYTDKVLTEPTRLLPNQKIHPTIRFFQPITVENANIPYITNYIKILAATESADVGLLQQDNLKPTVDKVIRRREKQTVPKSWFERLVEVRFMNSFYKSQVLE